MRRTGLGFLLLVLVAVACGDESASINAERLASAATMKRAGGRRVIVMTRNMDAGTDLGPVVNAASVPDLLRAMADTYAEILGSGIPERAAGIADEIAAWQPDLVALQEVTVWRTGPFLQPPANDILFDQLALLLAELKKRGLEYVPIVVQQLADAEAPVPSGFDLRITDEDVILARADVRPSLHLSNAQAHVYRAELVLGSPVLGTVAVPRSYTSVDVRLRGRSFRFVNTHLESFVPAIQVAQAEELIAALAGSPLPVVLAGDFNANAEPGPDHLPTVDKLLAAGYADAWRAAHPNDPGFTWPLHGEDPFTAVTGPTERIDLVFTRGPEVLSAERVGARLQDRTASGLWPSDHAGVVAALQLDGDEDVDND